MREIIFLLTIVVLLLIYTVTGSVILQTIGIERKKPSVFWPLAIMIGYAVFSIALSLIHTAAGLFTTANIALEGSLILLAVILVGILLNKKKLRVGSCQESIFYSLNGPPKIVWIFILFASVLVCACYLPMLFRLPAGGGQYFVGSNIFDFEKHVGILLSLISGEFPLPHYVNSELAINYYTGFYLAPAFLGSLLPAYIMEVLLAQFFCTYMVIGVTIWLILDATVQSPKVKYFGAILLFIGTQAPYLFGIPQKYDQLTAILNTMYWMPQHIVAFFLLIFAFCILSNWRKPGDMIILALLLTFSITSSVHAGIFLCAVLAIYGVTHIKETFTYLKENVCLVICLSLLFILSCFAQYGTLVLGFFQNAGKSTGNVLSLTDNFADNLAVLLHPAGISTIFAIFFPFFKKKKEILGTAKYLYVLFCCNLLAVLSFHFYSEIFAKASILFAIISVVLALIAIDRLDKKAILIPIAAVTCINAAYCFSVELEGIYAQIKYSVRSSADQVALVDYVRQNTKATEIVSNFFDNQTVYECQLTRLAYASGEDPLPRLQDVLATGTSLDAYREKNGNLLTGLIYSDYIYMSKELSGLSTGIVFPSKYDRNLFILEQMGYEIVFENEAGVVGKNMHRYTTVEECRDMITVLDVEDADTLFDAGNWQDAAAIYQEYLQTNPSDATALYRYAYCLHCSGDYEGALPYYGKSLENGFAEFWVRYNRADAYLNLGMLDKAREDIIIAHTIDPSHEGAAALYAQLVNAA